MTQVNPTTDWYLEVKTEGKGRWYGRLFPPHSSETDSWIDLEHTVGVREIQALRDPTNSLHPGMVTNFFAYEDQLVGNAIRNFAGLAESGSQLWRESDYQAGEGTPLVIKE